MKKDKKYSIHKYKISRGKFNKRSIGLTRGKLQELLKRHKISEHVERHS
jgi:hypothetical protein